MGWGGLEVLEKLSPKSPVPHPTLIIHLLPPLVVWLLEFMVLCWERLGGGGGASGDR